MRYLLFAFLLFVLSCQDETPLTPLDKALLSDSELITKVMENPDFYELQIKLSVLNKSEDSLWFDEYEFMVEDSNYFYPASTVKFPVSLLALEKLQELDSIDLDTPFFVEGDSSSTTMRHEIRDIFAVSSNDTYNRLFEFLGKDHINQRLIELGLQPARISHRLSTSNAFELSTKEVIFELEDSVLRSFPNIENRPIIPLELNRITKGTGYFDGELLVEEPMDFSERNYLPISTIHEMMKRIMFPKLYGESERFKLNDKYYNFIKQTMAILPKEMGYTSSDYFDGFGKFFIYGDTMDDIPDHIKIYNKVGYAYGYLTDCAYIVDSENDIEYILSATIHVNKDGIFNDDVYEYDDIGIPFLAQLGREIHNELILR